MTIWHSGAPPHVGWWRTDPGAKKLLPNGRSVALEVWRWWDGVFWSVAHGPSVVRVITDRTEVSNIMWCDYYPENARVPRINPNEYERLGEGVLRVNAGVIEIIVPGSLNENNLV